MGGAFNSISTAFASLSDYRERWKYPKRVIPPRSLRRAGGDIAGYVAGGDLQRNWLVEYAQLQPSSHLLDIGCGDGRLASALGEFFTTGTYKTFEVQQRYVDSLRATIGRKNPRFEFAHADLWHAYYNPRGRHKTTAYLFPYKDNEFDVVFLNSIFTHFTPPEIEHYLSEIYRVLRPTGTMMATYFIANAESIALDAKGLSSQDLRGDRPRVLNHSFENYWTKDDRLQETLVALNEAWLRQTYRQRKMEILSIVYGTWCGRDGEIEASQDIVISRKYE